MTQADPYRLLATLDRLETLRDPQHSGRQRQFNRHIVRGDAELHPVDQSALDASPVPITLRDIGGGGLGFICDALLPAGSTWRVCFLMQGFVIGQQTLVVRHCRKIEDGVYLVGGQFCIEPGLMVALGVDPTTVRGETSEDNDAAFLPPGEVA